MITNLVRNSIEALKESEGRRLTISTEKASGHSIVVTVSDSGPGLCADVAEHLFQPVRSQKPHGMGIGLMVCHAIVTAHGGEIWAESKPGKETAFRFTLPLAEADDG